MCSTTFDAVVQESAEDRVVDAVIAASRALVGVAARSLADIDDVTLPQYRALVLIWTRDGTTVSDLASALDIHPTSATRLVDRLVRKKLVRRAESSADRRRTELHLAASGQHLLERVTDRRRAEIARITARLGPAAAERVRRALSAFAAAADDSASEAADLLGWGPET
jgi:DNA-binding MarR family transcriptional regulator